VSNGSDLSIGNAFEDRSSFVRRLAVLHIAIVVAFCVLAVSFWYFQVVHHDRFQEMADNNHQRTLSLRAPRGVLFDRQNRVLVENRYAYHILLLREQSRNVPATVKQVAALTHVDESTLMGVVADHRFEPKYRPVVLIDDASEEQVAAVMAHKLELPDIDTQIVPARHYPSEQLAAHLIGYVGEVTEAQLTRPDYAGLQSGAIVGQSGVEHAFNRMLMGVDGKKQVIVNSVGREILVDHEIPPNEGERLQLSLDYDLQRAAEEGFKALGYSGAAVVLQPKTGEVLALVSLPAYDPNAFVSGIDPSTWNALNRDRLKPLQNRALQGRYSPGSTFKIVIALAALQEGVAKPSFRVNCPGGASFYGRYFACHLKGGHGTVDMRTAIEKSCNVYFYTLGNMLGIDRIHKWATALGLGIKSGIDLPNEIEGIMPSSSWKRQVRGEKWYLGETISVAIGQGYVSVTPLSLAVMMATIANGGIRYEPHVLRAKDDNDGTGWKPIPAKPGTNLNLDPETVDVLHEGLWRVVNGAGTGGRARLEGYNVGGKTGTAQVISNEGKKAAGRTDKDLRDHGWFVFFAPSKGAEAELAGVMFAEHSEHGYLAAPIAKHVINTWFAKKEGRPLPAFPAPAGAATTVVASAPAAPPTRPGGDDRMRHP
jgi:penicillin-binding protein 2